MKTKGGFFIVGLIFCHAAIAQIGSKVKEQATQGLAGTWVNTAFGYTMTLLLLDNGSGDFDGEAITYKASDNNLAISFATETVTYRFTLSGNQLSLSGGDLDAPISFQKAGSAGANIAKADPVQATGATASGASNAIIGKWETQGQVLDFGANNKVVIDGNSFDYQTQGNNLTLSTPQGAVQFQYAVAGDKLTLTGPGGSLVYNRFDGNMSKAGNQAGTSTNGSSAPAELAGKWCYVNVASTGSGGWSTDECIILSENGTYEYYSENSGSATVTNQYGAQIATGGTNSQTSDAGTWSLQGNMLVARSRSGSTQSFTFEKRNHPKNGDPMIVLNGRTYVTFYQKSPWR